MNRRKTGVNQVLLEDDNGHRTRITTASAKTLHLTLGILVAFSTLIGAVYGAAKWAGNIQIEDAVKEMVADEGSVLHREMVEVAEVEAEEIHAAFHDDLDVFEMEQKTQGQSIIRIETNVENLEKKIDDNKEDLIREIRRAGGGNE